MSEKLLCGVDLGGTKIAIALVRTDGTIHRQRQIRDHRGTAPSDVVKRIAATVRELARESDLDLRKLQGVGVGTSGHVDYDRGVLIINSNLPGFENFPLGESLWDELRVPVYVDNDANAQAWAEYRFGAGRGKPDMAFVTASTGVGAGLILGGAIFRGVTGTAGEFGHTIVEPTSSILCGCGRPGCLMAYTSGLTLPLVVREMLQHGSRLEDAGLFAGCPADPQPDLVPDREAKDATSMMIDFTTLSDNEITGELIGEGLERRDPFCLDVVNQYADYMAIGLHNLYQTINIGHFVLGGGLTFWGTPYVERIRRRFRFLVESMTTSVPEILLSDLGPHAAVIGAAALPLER